MTVYQYEVDLPYTTAAQNRRAFVKLPRSILLAPYLATNQYFVDFADSIDTVFDYQVEAKIDALNQIRNMWVSTPTMENKVANGEMIDFMDWGGPERAVIVSQVNLLGMKLANAGVVSETGYRAIAKFLGSYWFGKGKNAAIDFLNFCLGAGLTITSLVTQDYVHFYAPDDATVGAYIWDTPPGPWFATTHVSIGMPSDYGVDPVTLGSFFYEICNYNLVLYAISITMKDLIVTEDSPTFANVMLLGGLWNPKFIGQTPNYPIKYHSRVGGWTGGGVDVNGVAIQQGGVGVTLNQISEVQWPD
jgi:hypothetical protein